jgi:glyoxylase-like metal-dependent hydrolase (beta-lactamase superfamily II)
VRSPHTEPATGVGLPREIAPGIFWLGDCFEITTIYGQLHSHVSCFLLVGTDRTLLVDTGTPVHWQKIRGQLDRVLGRRPLDVLVPTHPEPAHAGNLYRLLQTYPDSRLAGDLRDYHLAFPDLEGRMDPLPSGSRIDLGGLDFHLLPAPIKDLTSTQWGYEAVNQVMFVGDGLAYTHPTIAPDAGGDEPALHRAGECSLLTTELAEPPRAETAALFTQAAFWWARYLDPGPLFAETARLIERYPSRLVAPAHGNVVADIEKTMAIVEAGFRMVRIAPASTGPAQALEGRS